MRIKTIVLSLGAVLVLGAAVAAPLILAPGQASPDRRPVAAVDAAEQAAIIEALRPTTAERPVIAIVARNDGTEIADFLLTNGVLRRADVGDVIVVAERAEPVLLYPVAVRADPDTTFADFDARFPDGADYIVIPAMDPGTDPVIAQWVAVQHGKGAKVVAICYGVKMAGTAGLLDGRRATAHWNAIVELGKKYPTMERVADRRYVADNGVATSTGITAAVPVTLALVEAIGGREVAARVAADIGLTDWDARHRSADFVLTTEHKKTFIRNALTFWRRDTIGVPLVDGADEIALALTLDPWSRTQLTDVRTIGADSITTAHGLVLHPQQADAVAQMLPAPPTESPAKVLDAELPRIAERYDPQTAEIVALAMEYPWRGDATQLAHAQ